MSYKQSLPQRIIKSIGIIALCALLSSCFSSDIDNVFDDYQNRLQRLLGQPAPDTVMPLVPRQPGISDVRQDIPESTIGLFESMRLNECRAGQLIAQRNSSLGRVQSVQARVLYELEMIPALADCLQHPEIAESNLGNALAISLAEKIDNLPLWIDRFWTSEPAIRDTFRPSRNTAAVDEPSNFQASLAALNYFSSLFSGVIANPENITVNQEEWQLHMQALGTGNAIPELLRTQQHVVGWLTALNDQLADGANALGCENNTGINSGRSFTPQNAHYMQNVLNTVWIGRLQPALARWDNEYRQLTSTMKNIQSQVISTDWQHYLTALVGEDSFAAENRQLARLHAEKWQVFLAACNLEVR